MNISFYTSVNSPPTSLLTVGPALLYVNVQSGASSCCERDLRVFRKTEWVCLKRTECFCRVLFPLPATVVSPNEGK